MKSDDNYILKQREMIKLHQDIVQLVARDCNAGSRNPEIPRDPAPFSNPAIPQFLAAGFAGFFGINGSMN
jgi:hypothetical protein